MNDRSSIAYVHPKFQSDRFWEGSPPVRRRHAVSYFIYIESPIGRLMLCSDGVALTGVHMDFPASSGQWSQAQGGRQDATAPPLADAARQLGEYFARSRREFDVPLALKGTKFQERVWRALLVIPYGETWSYGQLAEYIGNPKASRAVGLANGSNPLSIIVPCHRVIGADGSLTGYGGGIERKRWLLAHEGHSRVGFG